MRFSELVATSASVGSTRARRQKVARLAECLRALRADEVRVAVPMLAGEVRQGRLGVGHATLFALSVEPSAQPALELLDVDRALDALQALSGRGVKAERERLLGQLFARATQQEQGFLKRLLLGELRQGALEGVMLDAIAEAYAVPAAEVRRAAMLSGDLAEVAHTARVEGSAGLGRFRIELMRPLAPMLAQSADDLAGVLRERGPVSLEHKLDGARVQVHRVGDEVRVFTRKLHEVTERVPELVERVRTLPADSLVLDGEVLAQSPAGRPLPFQVTMRRFGRKLDVARMQKELPLSVRFFDCLHLDGRDLLDQAQEERFAALSERTEPDLRVPRTVTSDLHAADGFLAHALAAGHEGVMAKDPGGAYEAGRRGAGWLKVKPVRTLDLVVVAVEQGSGRRAGLWSNIHLAARDPQSGRFLSVGKTFKGMTDATLAWQTEHFPRLALGQEGHVLHLRPEQVVEVAFDGVQHSPHYESGVALRFARVKRYRGDKPAAEADTLDTLRALLPEL